MGGSNSIPQQPQPQQPRPQAQFNPYTQQQYISTYAQQQQVMYNNLYSQQPLVQINYHDPSSIEAFKTPTPKPQTVQTLTVDVSMKKESLKLVPIGDGTYTIKFAYDCKVPAKVRVCICANEIYNVQEFPPMRIVSLMGKPKYDDVRIEAGKDMQFSNDKIIFDPKNYTSNEIFNYNSESYYSPMALILVIF